VGVPEYAEDASSNHTPSGRVDDAFLGSAEPPERLKIDRCGRARMIANAPTDTPRACEDGPDWLCEGEILPLECGFYCSIWPII
jgi:hypothetical protein